MSKAFDAFLRTAHRVLALAEHELQLRQGSSPDAAICNDIIRACVVLAVAAMDMYFTRRFEEALVPFLKAKGKPPAELVGMLKEAGLDTEQALMLIAMDRPYARVRRLVRAHLSEYTTQNFDKIDRLFRCLGIKDLCAHAQAKARRKRLLRSVRVLVSRRNSIVHEGDLNDHRNLQNVNARQLVKRIGDLVVLVESANSIIANAMKPA